MLESVHVRNFQSLVDATVELGRVTVILGPNDFGKSALLRALRYASEAQQGNDFITYGKTHTSVTVEGEGHTLVWDKGAKVNRYVLDGVKFEKVGRQVPAEVSSFLGLSPVDFDRDLALNINFADQDEPAFLVPIPGGLTPSGVAKVLGDLTNLNILFKSLHEVDSRRRRVDEGRRSANTNVENLSAALEDFVDLDDMLAEQDRLEKLYLQCYDAQQTLDKLKALRAKREELRDRHVRLSTARKLAGDVPSEQLTAARSVAKKLTSLREHRDKYFKLVSQLATTEERRLIARQQFVAAQAEREEAGVAAREVRICPTCRRPL